MKVEIIKGGVTDSNSLLDVGMEIVLDDKNAASLIKDGYAKAVEEETPDGPTIEEMTAALDAKYAEAKDIKAAAESVGVAFATNATKAAVIAAVIEAGKYADLM